MQYIITTKEAPEWIEKLEKVIKDLKNDEMSYENRMKSIIQKYHLKCVEYVELPWFERLFWDKPTFVKSSGYSQEYLDAIQDDKFAKSRRKYELEHTMLSLKTMNEKKIQSIILDEETFQYINTKLNWL